MLILILKGVSGLNYANTLLFYSSILKKKFAGYFIDISSIINQESLTPQALSLVTSNTTSIEVYNGLRTGDLAPFGKSWLTILEIDSSV